MKNKFQQPNITDSIIDLLNKLNVSYEFKIYRIVMNGHLS